MTADTAMAAAEPNIRRVRIGFCFGVICAILFVAYGEWQRWQENQAAGANLPWVFDFNIDSTPYALLLLILPICWIGRRSPISRRPAWLQVLQRWLAESPDRSAGPFARMRSWLFAALVAITALVACVRVADTPVRAEGERFGDLPPAFHDEFSYLFQAQTFLASRWSYPSHPTAARLFDQMHVFNEGRFASRYFPGNGLWIAPFLALGSPYLGHWLATAIVAALVFAIGRELACNGVGLLAGMLTALSPGMDLFGNLLLAHQPTLVGLSVFVYGCLRLLRILAPTTEVMTAPDEISRRGLGRWTLVAGCGLAFAMLCRPMTAAGIALPFGLRFAWWLLRCWTQERSAAMRLVAGFAVPLMLGFATILWQNYEITGRLLKTPYALYTELFTPRHMYGFNNVVRAEPYLARSPRVIHNYDRWAENLTPGLAVRNIGYRLLASWLWTLGVVPLLVSTTVWISAASPEHARWRLIVAAIVCLHAVHVPYWYHGIMYWHYVFESGPLWCLIAAGASSVLVRLFRQLDRPWMPIWWSAVMASAVIVNQVPFPPFWPTSRVEAGAHELAFSRLRHHDFQQAVRAAIGDQPAIVLVRHDPSDRHIDYINNPPSLDAPLLFARMPAAATISEEQTIRLAADAYPDRAIYLVDIKGGQIARLR